MTCIDARSGICRFEFRFPGPGPISVVGEFNQWSPRFHPMRFIDGAWRASVRLAPGRYRYGFDVRGAVFRDNEPVIQECAGGWPWSVFRVPVKRRFEASGMDLSITRTDPSHSFGGLSRVDAGQRFGQSR